MKQQQIIRLTAGSLTLISALLGYFFNKNWLFLAIFVGLNLMQFSFTNYCPLKSLLKKMGVRE